MLKLLQAALRQGGEFADIYLEKTLFHDLSLRDGKVNAAGIHTDSGMGIRVVDGQMTGYAYTESDDPADALRAAQTAGCIADGRVKAPEDGALVAPLRSKPVASLPKNPYSLSCPWDTLSAEEKIPYLQELNDLIFSGDQRVKKVLARLADTTQEITYYNSHGEYCTDLRPMASLSVSCIMEANGSTQTASASRSFRMGAEFLSRNLIAQVADEVLKKAAFQFLATQPKGGRMPVVMASGGSGILLHEAIGHAFEADFVRKKQSIFYGKMGQRVAMEGINVVDDGTLTYNRGAINFDDEGIRGQKTYMVTDGILTSFLHDRISAKHFHLAPTGNGRRESFRYMPIPRMRATYMENGTATKEDLIADVKKGLYVDSFSNGEVQIGAGDFTFYVKSGYLIENGKLTQPVKDVNVIGNGPQALADICGVANDFSMEDGTWTCGKEQSCPVGCGMPSALVSQLTVGGSL